MDISAISNNLKEQVIDKFIKSIKVFREFLVVKAIRICQRLFNQNSIAGLMCFNNFRIKLSKL
jgi:hypothetical protein